MLHCVMASSLLWIHVFYKKKVYKKMLLKWSNSKGKFLENHKAQLPKVSAFIGQKSRLRHYYMQNVKDRFQIPVYMIYKEKLTNLSQFI